MKKSTDKYEICVHEKMKSLNWMGRFPTYCDYLLTQLRSKIGKKIDTAFLKKDVLTFYHTLY